MATVYTDATLTPQRASRPLLAGRILSGLAIAMLGLDATMKLVAPQMMIANTPPLGIPADANLYRLIGAILGTGLVLHLIPRTRFVGALAVTAFLGGAVAINLRAGMPLFSNTLFGVYVGLLFWAGYLMREPRIAALIR